MSDRIPTYDPVDPDGMLQWFSQMSARGLLFHPEDDPADIVRIETGERVFDDDEIMAMRAVIGKMESEHGEGMIEACYPIFMRACGQRLDA